MTPNNTLPEELAKEINRNAELYANFEVYRDNNPDDWDKIKDYYVGGATEYAQKVQALQAKCDRMEKALRNVKERAGQSRDLEGMLSACIHIYNIADEALKEGGEDE